jgi:HK97 gp10 family phage protein
MLPAARQIAKSASMLQKAGNSIKSGGIKIHIRVDGAQSINAAFDLLGKGFNRKVVKPAMQKVLRKIVAKVKRDAPVKTGLLKESIKSTGYVTSEGEIRGMVFSGKVSKAQRGKAVKNVRATLIRRFEKSKPTKYARLVEFGTKFAKAHPFMVKTAEAEWSRIGAAEVQKSLSEQVKKIKAFKV